ncbi:hypothetical protein V6N13_129539 [Hibiscus sabdariffa]
MGFSLPLGLRQCSNDKVLLRVISKGSLSQIRVDGNWVRVRGNHVGVKAKSWISNGAWIEAGGGFEAVKIKNPEMSSACIIGKEFASGCRTGKVPMERAFLSFQATWLPLHARNSVSKLTHGWWTEISWILSPIILGVYEMVWFSLETAEMWSNIIVGTTFWLRVIGFYSWKMCKVFFGSG